MKNFYKYDNLNNLLLENYLKNYTDFNNQTIISYDLEGSEYYSQFDKIIEIISNRALTNVGILLRFNTTQTAFSHSGNAQRSVQYVKDYFE